MATKTGRSDRFAGDAASICVVGLAAAALLFFLRRSWHGLSFLGFSDEAQHLVAALAIHAGDKLYRDFIDWHGPTVYMLVQFYGFVSGWGDLVGARLIPSALGLLAVAAIATSTCLDSLAARLLAAAMSLGLLASIWLLQGLYLYSYHPIAGALVLIALAWFVVPAWLGTPLPEWRIGVAGAALALTCFTAYSFVPSALALALSAFLAVGPARRALRLTAGPFLLGAVLAVLGVLAWLAVFGDIVGFLVFHVLSNQRDLARYMHFTLGHFLGSFVPSAAPARLVHDLALVGGTVAFPIFLLLAARRGRNWRSVAAILLGASGVALLNARGATIFQDGPFLMVTIGLASLAVPALALAWRPRASPWREMAAAVLIAGVIATVELVERHAVATPSGYTRAQMAAVQPTSYAPWNDPMNRAIRSLTSPDERILALVFAPQIYLSADRLPMRKYYEYLPWEADYARAPLFGCDRDLCVDLAAAPPPVVYYDHWTVWTRYPASQFMPCVDAILSRLYVRHAEFPDLYVRRDRAAAGRPPP
jgi:hypothetical protein